MFGLHPGVIFAIATVYSIAVFLGVWYFLNYTHKKVAHKWLFINRFLERARRKGDSPLVRRYGLIGLTILMAIPFPTIGVYGASSLSWVMGANQWRAMIAVVSGVAVSNSIFLLSLLGVIRLTSLIV
ncbi:MAG: small multi-drug export protein [Dehalococcoidales bacterium]|nr:MAG: small multi-drug export protein [Dehalococcoidales bacterium]